MRCDHQHLGARFFGDTIAAFHGWVPAVPQPFSCLVSGR
jgi:hypothetical protein